ncbi:ATP-grasp domain-containing protein [Streptomyces sp. INA 01156]
MPGAPLPLGARPPRPEGPPRHPSVWREEACGPGGTRPPRLRHRRPRVRRRRRDPRELLSARRRLRGPPLARRLHRRGRLRRGRDAGRADRCRRRRARPAHPGLRATRACRSKYLQRWYLPEFSPRSLTVPGGERDTADLSAVRYPAVVKPAGRHSSSGGDRRDRRGAAAAARRLPGARDGARRGEVIGQEYSVESLVQHGRVLFASATRKDTTDSHARTFVELSHTVPSDRPEHDRALLDANARMLEQLGFRDGIAHAEWRVDAADRPVLMEVAARTPGDGLCVLYELATGAPLEPEIMRIALGEPASYPAPARVARQVYLEHGAGVLRDVTVDGFDVTPAWVGEGGLWPRIAPGAPRTHRRCVPSSSTGTAARSSASCAARRTVPCPSSSTRPPSPSSTRSRRGCAGPSPSTSRPSRRRCPTPSPTSWSATAPSCSASWTVGCPRGRCWCWRSRRSSRPGASPGSPTSTRAWRRCCRPLAGRAEPGADRLHAPGRPASAPWCRSSSTAWSSPPPSPRSGACPVPAKAARVLRDKGRLREALAGSGVDQPAWALVAGPEEVAAFRDAHGGEAVLKPAWQASLGVQLLGPGDDVTAAWRHTTTADEPTLRAQYPGTARYLVEQRLYGPR